MHNQKYNWVYGENACQNYHEVKLGADYLCVYANKKYPEVWMAFYIKNKEDVLLMDKTYNDGQCRKEAKMGCRSTGMPSRIMVLSGTPEYMMKKVIYTYEHDLREVSR